MKSIARSQALSYATFCLRIVLFAAAFLLIFQATRASFFEPVALPNAVTDVVTEQFAQADSVKKKTYKVMRSDKPIELGGNIRRFTSVPVIELTHRETGAHGTYRIIADPTGLYISGEISDSRLNTHFLEKIWLDDSIEIMVDADYNEGNSLAARDFKFIVNLLNAHFASEAGKASDTLPFDSQVKYDGTLNKNFDSDKGYKVETKIPWSSLGFSTPPAKGKVFGFELGLNDSIDKNWQRWYRQRYWSNSDGGSANNPSGWGALIFTDEPVFKNPELTFTQSAAEVIAGGSVKLTWSATNAGYCTASGDWNGKMPVSGTETIGDIQSEKTLTLTCGGLGGKVEKTLKIKVLPPEQPSPNFSIEKLVSSDGDNFSEHIVLQGGSTAHFQVTIKNLGNLAGNVVVKDQLLMPTNGGKLGDVKDISLTCPEGTQCDGTITGTGVTINGLPPEKEAVITYKRSVLSSGISSGGSSFIVDIAFLNNDLGASTSSVEVRANYPVIEEAICPDADIVVPIDLWVAGAGCEESGHTEHAGEISVDVSGNYDISAYAVRGESGQCNQQTNEAFTIDIGGKLSTVADDDQDDCTISSRNQYMGTFELLKGKNAVKMKTASQCPPDDSANSVKITHLCLEPVPVEYDVVSVTEPFAIDGLKEEYEFAEPIILSDTNRGFEGSIRAISSRDGLHLFAEVTDPDMASRKEFRDADLLQDDSVMVMIDAEGNEGAKPQADDYRFLVNLRNAKADAKGEEFAWNTKFDSVVRYAGSLNDTENTDLGYEIEMLIPWKSIGFEKEPDAGSEVGFDLVINDADSARNRLIYAWSNSTGGAVHDPNGWGLLRFAGVPEDMDPRLTFTQSATTVKSGGAATISWETKNATSCIAYGDWQGDRDINGTETITNITGNKIFTLACSGEYGSVVKSIFISVSENAPEIALDLSATAVKADGSSTISWSATNAEICRASGDWSGEKPVSGSEDFKKITADKTFSLSCSGANGMVTKSVKVSVSATAPTLAFTGSAKKVRSGTSLDLRWDAGNASKCVASGAWSGEKALKGAETIPNITSEKTFTLTCTGNAGSVQKSVSVGISATAPTLEFTSDLKMVAKGNAVKLSWKATDATSCVASADWQGVKNHTGNENIQNLTANKRFVLSCSGAPVWDGTSAHVETVTKVIEITVTPALPELTLETDKTSVASGGSVKLSWNTKNATTCLASGDWSGTKAVLGSEQINNLTTSKTFTLKCTGAGGDVTKSVTVTVTNGNPNPLPSGVCHQLNSTNAALVPAKFAYPWNVFSAGKELILKVLCKAEGIEATIGTGKNNFFIWRQGYITKDGKTWQLANFTGDNIASGNKWIIGTAKLNETYPVEKLIEPNFIVAYYCAYEGGTWKCGCREKETCTSDGKWMYQSFKISPADPGQPPAVE